MLAQQIAVRFSATQGLQTAHRIRLAGLAQQHQVEMGFTVSCDLEALPESLKGYVI